MYRIFRGSVFLDFQGKGLRYPQHYLVALLNLLELFHLLPHFECPDLSVGPLRVTVRFL